MTRMRRFKVENLEGAGEGEVVRLSDSEVRHLDVLRLQAGAEIEIFDGQGWGGRAQLLPNGTDAKLIEAATLERIRGLARVRLATAWPKGKRAAMLVEKCTELGVAAITPLACERSVVRKRTDSTGVARLQRIADEAAKQSGRKHAPKICEELGIERLMEEDRKVEWILLHPDAKQTLAEALARMKRREEFDEDNALGLMVGPEGGFTHQEVEAVKGRGGMTARLSVNILRVETAAMAACAIAGMEI